MSEYVSKEWLKEHIEVISYEGMWHETETDEFVSVENIDSAPSIDIVWCKECKHRKKNGFCLEHNRYEKNDNGYCSYGEREGK